MQRAAVIHDVELAVESSAKDAICRPVSSPSAAVTCSVGAVSRAMCQMRPPEIAKHIAARQSRNGRAAVDVASRHRKPGSVVVLGHRIEQILRRGRSLN